MLKRNLIANFLGQGWSALMSLAFVPLYIHYLGIEAYGVIGLFALLQSWLTLLDMGMTPTLSREMARFTGGGSNVDSVRDLLRSIECVACLVALFMAGGVWLASGWLATSWLQASAIPTATLVQAFSVMGAVAGLRFIEGIYRGSIVGLQRQVLFNVVSSIMATVRGLGAVAVLALAYPTVQAFFIWQGIVSIATVAALGVATYGALPHGGRGGRFDLESLRRVWTFAAGMFAITILSLLLTQVDKLLLSRMLPLADYGYYMLASAVASALMMLIAPISQAWFPRLTQLHAAGDEQGFARAYHQGAQLVSVIAGSAAMVIATFPDVLLTLWTGDAELAGRTAMLLRLLVIGNLLNSLMWMPYQAQLAYRWPGLAAKINVVAVIILVPAILWITPRYGAAGAAGVWILLNASYVTIGANLMYHRILSAERWTWYGQDLVLPLGTELVVSTASRLMLPVPSERLGHGLVLMGVSALTLGAAAATSPVARACVMELWRTCCTRRGSRSRRNRREASA